MNLSIILILGLVNFTTLIVVSVIILYYVKKTQRMESEAASKLLAQEQTKLHSVLDELSQVSSILYADIDKKKIEIKRLISDAQDRIDVLEGLIETKFVQTEVKPSKDINIKNNNLANLDKDNIATLNPLHKEVYALSDKGLSILEIAKYLKKSKGEIELILNLRQVLSSVL